MTDPADYACRWDAPSCKARVDEEVKQLRARVAELEAALDHYSGGASEALLRAPAMKEGSR